MLKSLQCIVAPFSSISSYMWTYWTYWRHDWIMPCWILTGRQLVESLRVIALTILLSIHKAGVLTMCWWPLVGVCRRIWYCSVFYTISKMFSFLCNGMDIYKVQLTLLLWKHVFLVFRTKQINNWAHKIIKNVKHSLSLQHLIFCVNYSSVWAN